MLARLTLFWLAGIVWCSLALANRVAAGEPSADMLPVGIARIDITPEGPIRLIGYASRTKESEGVAQRLFAKALALGGDAGEGPALLVMVDNCTVQSNVVESLADRLKAKVNLQRPRLVVCSTHTHSGPLLTRVVSLKTSNSSPTSEQQARVDRYTEQLVDRLEQVALDALAARRPGRLAWAQGKVTFAANRRVLKDGKWKGFGVNPDGPVDHSLPLLRVTDAQGKLLAVVVNYACHATTIPMDCLEIQGDWPGYAQAYLEAEHPGLTAMLIIGCGADSNPEPRCKPGLAEQHGRAVADEVKRLLAGPLTPLPSTLTTRMKRIELPFDRPATRDEFAARILAAEAPKASGVIKQYGAHARAMLQRLDRGETLPTALPYPITTWTFGDRLAMVFLPGEVVVDYALRLKRECDGSRLWITAYANDVPGYIVSKRILVEEGYEADSPFHIGYPARYKPEVEDLIVETVRSLLPADLRRP